MKPKLLLTFALIVGLPLALLGWIGVGMARDERIATRERFRIIFGEKLRDVDGTIAELLRNREREILDRLEGIAEGLFDDPSAIRALTWTIPEVRHIFLLNNAGLLLFPIADADSTEREREFLARTESIWKGHELLSITRRQRESEVAFAGGRAAGQAAGLSDARSDNGSGGGPGTTVAVGPSYTSLVGRPDDEGPSSNRSDTRESSISQNQGWHGYFWNQGLQLLLWRRLPDGTVVGAELDRARLMADIIAVLPDTAITTGKTSPARTVLSDSQRRTVYEWGEFEREDEEPIATLALSAPLGAWSLDQYVSPEFLASGSGLIFNLIAGLSALGLALVGLATYFYRESSRDLRDASQRVSFVNQVSHELKTPLTNIRLYAELLERELGDDNEEATRELGVIVTESQRLSRLIGNILTFSRKSRGKLTLHPSEGVVDETVKATIERFRPLLAAKEIEIELAANAGETIRYDSDAVEQILGNLLANVEKYVPRGRRVIVRSTTNGNMTTIRVADDGLGIPTDQRDLVFEPFFRMSEGLTEGVSGTGIGLTIARDLARLHGGDLVLETPNSGEPGDAGAVFILTLRHS